MLLLVQVHKLFKVPAFHFAIIDRSLHGLFSGRGHNVNIIGTKVVIVQAFECLATIKVSLGRLNICPTSVITSDFGYNVKDYLGFLMWMSSNTHTPFT